MQAADVGGVQAMNKEPLLCSALAEQRVPQANNVLQCSLVCSSCLSIQVKWTAAASFAHNNMKQLENIFEKSRAISLCKSGICMHFFLYHTIFTRFGSVKTHFFHSLLNSVCIFFCGFQAAIQKRFLHPFRRSFMVWDPGQQYREGK